MSEGLHPRVHLSNQAKPGPPPERPRTPPPPPPPRWRMWLPWIGVAITLGILLFTSRMSGGQVQTLTYQPQLKDKIAAGQVKSVEIGSDGHIDGVLTDGTKFKSSYPVNLQDPQFTTLLEQHNVQVTAVGAQSSFVTVLVSLLPLLLFVGFFIYLGRSTRRQLGAIGGVGRSRGRVYDTDRPSTTFADVAGYEGVKREVTEVVDFLKNPDRYRRAGAMGPKGVLMVGPPGTDQTLNQLLSEMDGFDPATGVVVMAATNRPEVLDPALLRPGRFDRQVVIPLPTQRERKAILQVHANGKKLGPDVDLDVVARGTPGFSGADLANLINEAAIYAVRGGRDVLSATDFSEARDR